MKMARRQFQRDGTPARRRRQTHTLRIGKLAIGVLLAVSIVAISILPALTASSDAGMETLLNDLTPAPTHFQIAGKETASGADCNRSPSSPSDCTTGGESSAKTRSAPPATGSGEIIWTDAIQTGPSPWGFRYVCEHPIGTGVICSDSNGANISVVPDPAGGTGLAIRHYIAPTGGGRAQLVTSTADNAALANQITSRGEVWIEQEMYIPRPIPSSKGKRAWISIMDVHSTGELGANRWHTSPGLFFCSAALRCPSRDTGKFAARNFRNNVFAHSSFEMPVDRWFKVQVHVPWSTAPVPVTFYVDGKEMLQITISTKNDDHKVFEWYSKLYGGYWAGSAWSPNPLIRYTRNVRISDAFIP